MFGFSKDVGVPAQHAGCTVYQNVGEWTHNENVAAVRLQWPRAEGHGEYFQDNVKVGWQFGEFSMWVVNRKCRIKLVTVRL